MSARSRRTSARLDFDARDCRVFFMNNERPRCPKMGAIRSDLAGEEHLDKLAEPLCPRKPNERLLTRASPRCPPPVKAPSSPQDRRADRRHCRSTEDVAFGPKDVSLEGEFNRDDAAVILNALDEARAIREASPDAKSSAVPGENPRPSGPRAPHPAPALPLGSLTPHASS
jgi:hypothetical protein